MRLAQLVDALVWVLVFGGIVLLVATDKIDLRGVLIVLVLGVAIGAAVAALREAPAS